jgi:superfamily II DNA/RNA helicase
MTFDELGLNPEILKAIAEVGYQQPTPIQAQAIPVVLMGRDVLGCAQTGTGKTAGFTLPMIEILSSGRAKARMPRSLILEPTRELAAQVADNFEKYGKYCSLNYALLIGGESFVDQEKKLDRGVDVLIATPGRLIDLFERGKILMNDVKILVIDEADRMLDMGFIPDVERIVGLLPKLRQTLLFSATMAPEIRKLADAFLMNPKEISVAPPATAAATVVQALAVVQTEQKREALRRLIRSENVTNALIFCNRKRDVEILYKSLTKHGFDAVRLHGDMSQPARTETLDKFKKGEVRLMVCSDVAARGLDIKGLSHVFNFDVPMHSEDYVHRIGRTGRAGREGHAYTLAAPADGKYLAAIEKLLGTQIPRIEIEGLETATLSEGKERGGRERGGRERGGRERGGRERGGRPSRHDRGSQQREKRQAKVAEVIDQVIVHPEQETTRHAALEASVALPQPEKTPHPNRHQRRAKGRDQGGRDDHGEHAAAGAPAPRPPKHGGGHVHHENDDGLPGVAFGDHTPAFLLRRSRPGEVR